MEGKVDSVCKSVGCRPFNNLIKNQASSNRTLFCFFFKFFLISKYPPCFCCSTSFSKKAQMLSGALYSASRRVFHGFNIDPYRLFLLKREDLNLGTSLSSAPGTQRTSFSSALQKSVYVLI